MEPFLQPSDIIVVSGIPRSGTSMMMRMLAAGGLEVVEDGKRPPDKDNPHGYFEDERVKKLAEDWSWLKDIRGKAIKVIAHQVPFLPTGFSYKMILMERNLDQVLQSQKKMLIRLGGRPDPADESHLRKAFVKQLDQTRIWASRRPEVSLLRLDYNRILEDPTGEVVKIENYLGLGLNGEKMVAVVDPALNRNRFK